MVYRVFVEKKPGFDLEAKGMLADLKSSLGIEGLKDVRMFNRYDAENMSKEQFDYAVKYVFSEPQMDVATEQPDFGDAKVFAASGAAAVKKARSAASFSSSVPVKAARCAAA